MQMLSNFGAKRNLYFLPPSCLKYVPAPLRHIDSSFLFKNILKLLNYCKVRRCTSKSACVWVVHTPCLNFFLYLYFSKESFRVRSVVPLCFSSLQRVLVGFVLISWNLSFDVLHVFVILFDRKLLRSDVDTTRSNAICDCQLVLLSF